MTNRVEDAPIAGGKWLDRDTSPASPLAMEAVTTKLWHDQAGQLVERARRGEGIFIMKDGQPGARRVPADEELNPAGSEVVTEVWAAQAGAPATRPNPVLRAR